MWYSPDIWSHDSTCSMHAVIADLLKVCWFQLFVVSDRHQVFDMWSQTCQKVGLQKFCHSLLHKDNWSLWAAAGGWLHVVMPTTLVFLRTLRHRASFEFYLYNQENVVFSWHIGVQGIGYSMHKDTGTPQAHASWYLRASLYSCKLISDFRWYYHSISTTHWLLSAIIVPRLCCDRPLLRSLFGVNEVVYLHICRSQPCKTSGSHHYYVCTHC